jgi:hypothetical protein
LSMGSGVQPMFRSILINPIQQIPHLVKPGKTKMPICTQHQPKPSNSKPRFDCSAEVRQTKIHNSHP